MEEAASCGPLKTACQGPAEVSRYHLARITLYILCLGYSYKSHFAAVLCRRGAVLRG